jgi:hypothetical protein
MGVSSEHVKKQSPQNQPICRKPRSRTAVWDQVDCKQADVDVSKCEDDSAGKWVGGRAEEVYICERD